jgi:hypothetical protein
VQEAWQFEIADTSKWSNQRHSQTGILEQQKNTSQKMALKFKT